MDKFYNETIDKLESEIKEFEIDSSIQRIETVIELIVTCLANTKKYVLKTGFENMEDEVLFFKVFKPRIVSKLIYYNAIYKIEAKKPFGGKKVLRAYLGKELSDLKRFYDRNTEFCKYYRTNSTYLDHKYFARGQHDIKLSLNTIYFETDQRFSTSHDYKVAKIIANDLIQIYLEDRLNKKCHRDVLDDSSLNWTVSKAAAIELIYSLHTYGVFNNGNADIIAIANFFEKSFNIDLGDFYHTFLELKARKINRTKFLDSLRNAVIRRMDEDNEK